MVSYVYSWEYRLVDHVTIINRYKEKLRKALAEHSKEDSPVVVNRLNYEQALAAFLEFFNEVGEHGWQYCGEIPHPQLPYRGVYCFKRKVGRAKKEVKADEPKQEV